MSMDTNRPATPTVEAPGSAAGNPSGRLMLALDRLFKVGPYYPPGHAATRRVTSGFLEIAAEALGPAPAAVFRIHQGRLYLLDEPLDPDWPGVADFQQLLGELGIEHLEIDAKASVEDLLKFVSRFLAFRNEVAGVKHFRQMRFDGLPPTVRVGEKHFDVGQGDEEEGGAPDSLLGEDQGADEDESDDSPPPPLPSLRESKKPVAGGLEKLLNELEEQAGGDLRSRALESVALMLDKLDRAGRQTETHNDFLDGLAEARKARPDSSREDYELTLSQLRQSLRQYVQRGRKAETRNEHDGLEHLSILLQLLKHKQSPDVLGGVERNLSSLLERPLQKPEREVCVAGVLDLLRAGEDTARFKGVALVLDIFRASRPESAIRLVSEVCQRCAEEQVDAVWPYAVNQLLQGDDGLDPFLYRELCLQVASAPVDVMREQSEWLRKLSAMKEGDFADEVLLPPRVELYPVFSVLLEASHPGPIAVQLVKGLKKSPPNALAAAVLPLIDTFRHTYRDFLTALFADGARGEPSAEVIEEAGRILERELPQLEPQRRSEPWVPNSILALAEARVPNAERIFSAILSRRFLFLFPNWPKACREAVDQARVRMRTPKPAPAEELDEMQDPFSPESSP